MVAGRISPSAFPTTTGAPQRAGRHAAPVWTKGESASSASRFFANLLERERSGFNAGRLSLRARGTVAADGARLVAGCGGYDAVMGERGHARRGAAAAVLACTSLLGAGCAAHRSGAPAHESASRTAANSGHGIGSARHALGARYLLIARAGNRRLNADFDPLAGRDRNDLGRARADLRDAAATERLFDRGLLRIVFPSDTERVAQDLYRVNQARASLTTAAAASTSLRRLHTYERQQDAANRPVEQAVRTIRRQLGLPPPPTS